MKQLLVGLTLLLPPVAAAGDAFEAWTKDVSIRPVSAVTDRHSIHSYYVANPESPDGSRVLFFTSKHPAGHVGEIRVLDRTTAQEIVLAEDVHTEDAHRVACQQWLSGGKRVAFHEVVGKKWRVCVVDVSTREKVIVAENHQVGFGRPEGDLLPLYGCHWNPGPFRDLEIWDATSGRTATAATIGEVEARYGDWLRKEFGDRPCSIFFPVLSPDLKRVFFKIAAGSGGDDYMSKKASHRQGLVCYDFERATCIWHRGQWGHPGWTPDSRHIFEMGNITIDVMKETFSYTKLKDVPTLRGSHPSVSPDGTLMVTDGLTESIGGGPNEWGVMVADMNGGRWKLLHSFPQNGGARSWRRSDPHPVFNADGTRIYYNVSDGEHTRLMVAERR